MPLDTGGQIRLMAENLLNAGVNSITSSELNPSYPIGNLSNNYRGRPVKFNGTFIVDSANDKLYINDGGDVTVVVTQGTYTSRADFVQAVQDALDSFSSGFTFTWDPTTKSFSISRATPFSLRLSQTTDAIHNTIGFTGNTDLTGQTYYEADQRRFHWPSEFIKIDFGYFPDIGFLGIISDSRYVFSLSLTANVRIQANTIDDFTSPPLDRVLDITEQGIFEFFDDDDYNYRYWKLVIEDNNGLDDPKIGYMYLGEFHKFDNRYNAQGGENYSEDFSEIFKSEAGQIYALEKQNQKKYESITIQMIAPNDRDFLFDIWSRFKTVKPFFISIDPKLEISNNLSDYTFLCSFNSAPKFVHYSGNKYNTSFGVSEWL